MYNRVILIGRLVADPELKTTPNGVNVAAFRVAVDRPYKQDGERKVDFISIVAWRSQAEFVCRYFGRGKLIGVEGSIQTRDYTDKDGNKRYITEVVAERAFFVESKKTEPSGEPPSGFNSIEEYGDLPFEEGIN